MRITIEDLEALNELFDELEENHETEAAEWRPWCIEFQKLPVTRCLIFFHPTEETEVHVQEHLHKVKSLEETCVDYEDTIQELVRVSLQTFVPIF